MNFKDYREQFIEETGKTISEQAEMKDENVFVAFEVSNLCDAIYRLLDKLKGMEENIKEKKE